MFRKQIFFKRKIPITEHFKSIHIQNDPMPPGLPKRLGCEMVKQSEVTGN